MELWCSLLFYGNVILFSSPHQGIINNGVCNDFTHALLIQNSKTKYLSHDVINVKMALNYMIQFNVQEQIPIHDQLQYTVNEI